MKGVWQGSTGKKQDQDGAGDKSAAAAQKTDEEAKGEKKGEKLHVQVGCGLNGTVPGEWASGIDRMRELSIGGRGR